MNKLFISACLLFNLFFATNAFSNERQADVFYKKYISASELAFNDDAILYTDMESDIQTPISEVFCDEGGLYINVKNLMAWMWVCGICKKTNPGYNFYCFYCGKPAGS